MSEDERVQVTWGRRIAVISAMGGRLRSRAANVADRHRSRWSILIVVLGVIALVIWMLGPLNVLFAALGYDYYEDCQDRPAVMLDHWGPPRGPCRVRTTESVDADTGALRISRRTVLVKWGRYGVTQEELESAKRQWQKRHLHLRD